MSPLLLRNLEELVHIRHCWHPRDCAPVEISADEESAEPSPADRTVAVSTFSGGVDGFYTLWRHHEGHVGRRRVSIDGAVFINGMDHERDYAEAYRAACDRMRGPLADLGVTLIPVETNRRDIRMRRNDSFATVAIGALSLFAGRCGTGLFSAGASYVDLPVPNPSSPITDHLLSGDGFEAVLDGAETIRPRKIDAIADWPIARRLLRVCNDRERPYENCGRCEKCIRTLLGFRLSSGSTPECFDGEVTNAMIRAVKLRSASDLIGFRNLLRRAAEVGREREPWVRAVRYALRRGAVHSRITAFRDWTRARRAAREG
ncbi:MAG: hypothetical protein GC159_02475 [Phycisphaera sp.]|nr:hypothetical protein [Phycisphaera sp.]